MAVTFPVHGYHGTTPENAKPIRDDGYIIFESKYNWLGQGIYFFQDAPMHAWLWATKAHGNRNAVLRSRLQLGECLDLLDARYGNPLREAYQELAREYKKLGKPLPKQQDRRHELDCKIIDIAVDIYKRRRGVTIASVRAVFQEGKPFYDDSALFDGSNVQIAIRDLRLIEETDSLIEETVP